MMKKRKMKQVGCIVYGKIVYGKFLRQILEERKKQGYAIVLCDGYCEYWK